MRYVSESSEKKQYVLIVDSKSTHLTKLLQEELKKFSSEVYVSPRVPLTFEKFNYIFFVNDRSALKKVQFTPKQKVIFIFINQRGSAQDLLKATLKEGHNIRIISCEHDQVDSQNLEKILWFSFSQSAEKLLNIGGLKRKTDVVKKNMFSFENWKKLFSRRRIIITTLLLLLFAHLAMAPFLALSSYFYYKSARSLKSDDIDKTDRYLAIADNSLSLAKILYSPVRPTYLFFSLALFTDNVFDVNDKTKSILQNSISVSENANQILKAILKKNKSVEEKRMLEVRFAKINKDIDKIYDDLILLAPKIPESPKKLAELKSQVAQIIVQLEKGKKILPHMESLLAKNEQKKYLLLFANNMELRPGGGFIGSFGILTMKDLTLDSIEIYDVYDADGQLTIHVDPPDPIRRYLQQPHWFLRDSAFSSDFFENYNEAKFFLDRELGLANFSGGILLTTTSIQNILEAYGNIYLPDFNENVNKDNFYIKAQLYAEKEFFPGSIQKKNFLGDLAKQILINLDTVSAPILLQQVEKSLDEKQLVMIFDDAKVQEVVDSLYWSGKTITPTCTEKVPTCIIDYLFPVDANLGVNKANFFIRRDITQKIKMSSDGVVTNSFVMKTQNDSANEAFPGGIYKNYFQLFLPLGSEITSVTRDGTIVEPIDHRQTEFRIIGFYFELMPQKSTEIQVNYRLPQKIVQGRNIYQLVWQKQTGSQNSDLNLEISLPENASITRQNFSPLVKDSRIFYNTSLNADKIFLIEFLNK